MKKSPSVIAVVFTTVVAAVAWSSPASSRSLVPAQASPTPNAVIAWNANAGDAALAACISPGNDPLHESRLYAMMHVAIHDALNAIDRRSSPTPTTPQPRGDASPDAAVASAARGTCCSRCICGTPIPTRGVQRAGVASVKADYAAASPPFPPGRPSTQGIELGAGRRCCDPRNCGRTTAPTRRSSTSDYPRGRARRVSLHPGHAVRVPAGVGRGHPVRAEDGSQFNPGPPYAVTQPASTRPTSTR